MAIINASSMTKEITIEVAHDSDFFYAHTVYADEATVIEQTKLNDILEIAVDKAKMFYDNTREYFAHHNITSFILPAARVRARRGYGDMEAHARAGHSIVFGYPATGQKEYDVMVVLS
jgi:hypothetical protein